MPQTLAALVVFILHMAFVAFMAWAPFSGRRTVLVAHLVITPFLWIHWILNQDACALTTLETRLRGVGTSRSFFHSLVSPIYKVRDSDVRTLVWIASVALWIHTARQVGWKDVVDVLRT
jgi:hypothetical protein